MGGDENFLNTFLGVNGISVNLSSSESVSCILSNHITLHLLRARMALVSEFKPNSSEVIIENEEVLSLMGCTWEVSEEALVSHVSSHTEIAY